MHSNDHIKGNGAMIGGAPPYHHFGETCSHKHAMAYATGNSRIFEIEVC